MKQKQAISKPECSRGGQSSFSFTSYKPVSSIQFRGQLKAPTE